MTADYTVTKTSVAGATMYTITTIILGEEVRSDAVDIGVTVECGINEIVTIEIYDDALNLLYTFKDVPVKFTENIWKRVYVGDDRRENASQLGWDSKRTWYVAFVYEKQSTDRYIKGVAYYDSDEEEYSSNAEITPIIYRSDNTDNPGSELWRGDPIFIKDTKNGWNEILIPSKDVVALDSYKYYWIVIEIVQDSTMLIGVDAGPAVPFGNLTKKNESTEWERLENYDDPNNWLIECLVE